MSGVNNHKPLPLVCQTTTALQVYLMALPTISRGIKPERGSVRSNKPSSPAKGAAMRKTHQVSSEESEPEQPECNVGSGAKSADQQSSVGENDIAWPVPVISMYPLAAALSGLMVWAFGLDWVLVSLIPFVIFLSAMTVIDLRELRIPDKLTKPAAIAAVPLLALSLLSEWGDISLVRALLGALAMGAFYFILFFIYPAGMGFGDVKLAPIIGAQLGFFGWIPEVRGLIAAYLIVGPVAILLLIFGRARMKTGFPFGPFMAIGAVVALVLEARGN